jgi:WD40 repeat protein
MNDVAFSPDGQSLAASTVFRGRVGVWNVARGNVEFTLSGGARDILCIAFRPDGKRLASASRDGVIRIWDIQRPEKPPQEIRGHESGAWDMAYSKSGERLVSSSFTGGVVHCWDPNHEQNYHVLRNDEGSFTEWPALDIAFSPDGRMIAGGFQAGSVQVWDLHSMSTRFRHDAKPRTGRNWVAFSPNSEILATLDEERSIELLNATTGELLRLCEESRETGQCGVFSPDGRSLVTTSNRDPPPANLGRSNRPTHGEAGWPHRHTDVPRLQSRRENGRFRKLGQDGKTLGLCLADGATGLSRSY